MENDAPRPIYVSILIGTLVLASLSLIRDNRSLSMRNHELLARSQNLQHRLNELSSQTETLRNGQTEKIKGFQDSIETLKKQNESLAFQLKKVESRISETKEEKSYLEEMLINKTKQIELLKSQGSSGDEAGAGEVRLRPFPRRKKNNPTLLR